MVDVCPCASPPCAPLCTFAPALTTGTYDVGPAAPTALCAFGPETPSTELSAPSCVRVALSVRVVVAEPRPAALSSFCRPSTGLSQSGTGGRLRFEAGVRDAGVMTQAGSRAESSENVPLFAPGEASWWTSYVSVATMWG